MMWNGGANPNTRSQEWSYWRFEVLEAGRRIPRADVQDNALRWLRRGFGSVGEGRVTRTAFGWLIEARIQGESASEPTYVASVRLAFAEFVRLGWGLGAIPSVNVKVLAGDMPRGARSQLVVMPNDPIF